MNTRQWIRLSGQYYAYISHDEQNDWMTFIRGTPEVLEEVLTDKLIHRLEADWSEMRDRPGDPAAMLKALLQRDQKASAALAAKARQWVEEELPKLRGEREEVDEEATAEPRLPSLGELQRIIVIEAMNVQEDSGRSADGFGTAVLTDAINFEFTEMEGFDSLNVIEMLVVLEERFGVELEHCDYLIDLHDSSTIKPGLSAVKLAELFVRAHDERLAQSPEHGVRGTEYEFKSAKELVETWNSNFPMGTVVQYNAGAECDTITIRTDTEAFVKDGEALIELEGKLVPVLLSDCVAI